MSGYINAIEFTEEITFVVKCPVCGENIESSEDPVYLDSIFCDQCGNDITVIND